MTDLLPIAWMPKNRRLDHPERRRMRESPARFKWLAAARRSGKTMDGQDYIMLGHGPRRGSAALRMWRGALCPPEYVQDPTYVVAAPTREMVKRLWWGPLKARLPRFAVAKVLETDLTIHLHNGSRIMCLGMDRPTRGEGIPIDGLVGDEFAYWRPEAFERSLRPALSTRGRPPGWAILMGKPSGRNHFWEGWSAAKSGTKKDHDAFHWISAVILDAKELEDARATMDVRSYQQEYEASFLTQVGRVYIEHDANAHHRPVVYDAQLPLQFCFDFNVAPGAAVVAQEQTLPPWDNPRGSPIVTTACIDEVHIRDDSTTRLVCAELGAKFAAIHKGEVLCWGDPGGWQRHSSSTESNDWAQVLAELRKYFPRVSLRVPRQAPPVIDSVNSVNSRLRSSDGSVRVAINAAKCQQLVLDLEAVVWEKSPDRKIDKDDLKRTHWIDALRYYIHERHPLGGHVMQIGAR